MKYLRPRFPYNSGLVSEGLEASVDIAFGEKTKQKHNGSLYSSGSLYSGK